MTQQLATRFNSNSCTMPTPSGGSSTVPKVMLYPATLGKLDKFKPEDSSFSVYLERMQIVFVTNNIPESKQVLSEHYRCSNIRHSPRSACTCDAHLITVLCNHHERSTAPFPTQVTDSGRALPFPQTGLSTGGNNSSLCCGATTSGIQVYFQQVPGGGPQGLLCLRSEE